MSGAHWCRPMAPKWSGRYRSTCRAGMWICYLSTLRERLERRLREGFPGLRINDGPEQRLPNTISITLPGVEADALMLNVPDLMLGTGSACNTGAIEPSHVLEAIGLTREEASQTVRVSLGRFTTAEQIEAAAAALIAAYSRHVKTS